MAAAHPFRCMLRHIMMWFFGILGAIAATIYWRYGIYVELSPPASWYALGRAALTYAAAGFVLGLVIGYAFGKIGHD
jgi:hypothetical protein